MSDQTTTHYEVRWKTHRSLDSALSKTSTRFSTLELAQREAERVRGKNRLFVEVDGFKPFVSAVSVWRVVTRTVRTEVEEPIPSPPVSSSRPIPEGRTTE